jgi:hypothetical protein
VQVTFNTADKVVLVAVAAGDRQCAALCLSAVRTLEDVLAAGGAGGEGGGEVTGLVLDLDSCSDLLNTSLMVPCSPSSRPPSSRTDTSLMVRHEHPARASGEECGSRPREQGRRGVSD